MKYIWPFFFILSYGYALESTDELKSKILKVYDKNIIVLNRGLEDDIIINDHIRLTSSNGFIARGICIKRGIQTAHFKIYRVTRPKLISKDIEYILSSINHSELPQDIEENYKLVDFTNYFKDWNEIDLDKQLKLQQKRFAKFDFPKDTAKDSILNQYKKSASKFVDKNFNSKQLMSDLKALNIGLYASPFVTESLNNQRDLNIGITAFNRGKKYDFLFRYNSFERKTVDPFTLDEVNRKRQEVDLSFAIKEIAKDWSFINMYRFESSQYSDIGNPREHHQLGVFGFKYTFNNINKKEFYDLTYQFFLDKRLDDVFISGSKDPQIFNLIRHGFRLRLKGFFNKDKTLSYFNELWWQPAMDTTTKTFDFNDNDTYNRFRFSVQLASKFYLDYENHYSSDINQQKLYGLDAVVISNIVNFRYQFEL